MLFRMLYDRKLAQAAYLIGCQKTGEAIVIDPQRDVDRYIEEARRERVRISAIAETHIHADFLSGARELAERTGARLYLSDGGDEDWKYRWLDKNQGGGGYDHQLLTDGDEFKVGNIRFTALHTPGHTPEHLCYLVTDVGGGIEEPMGMASGDFVFVGDVGRPDLLETAAGQAGVKEKSAQLLYRSIHRFKELPDYLQLWPGHGAGSACGKALGAVPQSTVGYEKRFNVAIADANDEGKFVESILYGQPEPPLYFARMKRENRDGPALLGTLPEPSPLNAEQLKKLVSRDVAILDTRPWSQYTQGHLPKALFAPLSTAFPTIAGSYVEPGVPIYLIVDEKRVREAVIDLIHVGLDEIVGYARPETLIEYQKKGGTLAKSNYMEITKLNDDLTEAETLLLDVRRADEFDAGHLPDAGNIAHTRLLAHLEDIPKDKKLMVYCETGSRSKYATALLERYGFIATQLDGGYAVWQKAGRKVSRS